MRLSPSTALALAIGGAVAFLSLACASFLLFSQPDTPPTPEPVTYSLHAFDLHGDGYPVTLDTGLTLTECEHRANLPTDRYLYVCREY